MSEANPILEGDDFVQGVSIARITPNGMLLGHARGEPVILARHGDELFAVGATCTHYGAPLVDGLIVGDTLRCPWHHACFSLRTGEALRAPALNPVSCWRVEQRDGKAYVSEKIDSASVRSAPAVAGSPESIVIIGGGAAGNAAAEGLRREGYSGTVTMLSADMSLPCDRPNLSKNFLAGSAPVDWLSLRSAAFYREHNIDCLLYTSDAADE